MEPLAVVTANSFAGLKGLISSNGYPTSFAAIKYVLGSHDQIFNQWKYDDLNRVWHWDKPGGGGLRENRYFVERIGVSLDGRDNWYAKAQASLRWALSVAMPCTPMLFMGTECYHYEYWSPADDPYGDHRFDWSIADDPTEMPMRKLVQDANAVLWNNAALRSDKPVEYALGATEWRLGFLAMER